MSAPSAVPTSRSLSRAVDLQSPERNDQHPEDQGPSGTKSHPEDNENDPHTNGRDR
ncbi:hypothetical protein N136_04684 [Leifsonia aquatica ATCC 14665]|uniref:Uncharacterized protein n=1 Tax=Leifsonia aquatica ATCC 14665 TaxID=1358026 RepID=U2SPA8_LEIAQ|nr:hypothetical protein N136_04684 [Leifsonia aquatica ATCC 14665]